MVHKKNQTNRKGFFLDIAAELNDLYINAKAAGKLDLAFRIVTYMAKMKHEKSSVDTLSTDDLAAMITECEIHTPVDQQTIKRCKAPSKLTTPKTQKAPLTHARNPMTTPLDLPP